MTESKTTNTEMLTYIGPYYKLTNQILGKGNFSTVYLAHHLKTNSKVALKIIDLNNIKEEYVRRHLRREEKILMKLNHRNIIRFYEAITEGCHHCLVLEFVEGEDLHHYLRRQSKKCLPEKKAKIFFLQMASAVEHMHSRGILHRDLKTDNILIEHDILVKVIDFGLSNEYVPEFHVRTHCGSLLFAAPELLKEHSVYGKGVDIWSLGVVLYLMVTGRLPFVVTEVLPDPKEVTKSFLQVVSKGLNKVHFEHMNHISPECFDLLCALLQPDQFWRIRTEGILRHFWFSGNLFQPPSDRLLRSLINPHVISYCARKLQITTRRLLNHLLVYKYDSITAAVQSTEDTCLKQQLYPRVEMRILREAYETFTK